MKILLGFVVVGIISAIAIFSLVFLAPLSHSLYSDGNTVGWLPFLLFIAKGWIYVVLMVFVAAMIVVILHSSKGGQF